MATAEHQSDRGRGRNADSPQEIPAKGWKDVLLRTYKEFNNDRVTMIAAAVTYFLLLSLFPTMTAFVSIYGLFTDPATVTEHLQLLSSFVPEGGMEILNEQLTRLASTGGGALSFALILSIALALWSASSGVKTLFEAMNIAYDERESRNFFKLNATALLFTLAGSKYDKAAAKQGKEYRFLFVLANGAQLQKITEIVEQKQIRPAVDPRVFSLSQANEALQLVSKGPIHGKVIIQM